MNIHQSEKKIRDLFVEGKRNSSGKNQNLTRRTYFPGVYVISRSLEDKKGLMKIGQAHGQGGIINRIMGQYKICLPLKSEEFYLRYVIITPREKENKHYSEIMESKLLTAVSNEMGIEDSYSKEYIVANDKQKLEKKIIDVLNKSEKYFTKAIKFVETGFYVYEKGSGFNTSIQDFDSIPTFNKAISDLLELRYGKQIPSAANILTSIKNSNVVQATVVNPTEAIVRAKRITKVPAKLKDYSLKQKTKKKSSGWWEYFKDWKKKNPTVSHTQALKDAGEEWRRRG